MVLKKGIPRVLGAVLAGLVLAGASGCLTRAAIPRLLESEPIAVAFAFDSDYARDVTDVPETLKRQVREQLALRNLVMEEVPFEKLAPTFRSVRESTRRFGAVQTAAPNARLRLLVEVKAQFFNQLIGRYRWDVFARATTSMAGEASTPISENMSLSAQLQFQHQREADAVAETSGSIAEKSARLVDGLLALPPSTGPDSATPGAAERPSKPTGDAIYFVLVDRFANGDPKNDVAVDPKDPAAFHGGDLQGVLDRLDYLQNLGVGTVWLSPVFEMRTEKFFEHGAFHGYWVEDVTKIEPRFGDAALLAKLSDALHARGMRLVLDIVLNHVAMDSPLVQKKPEWFNNKGPLVDWKDPAQLVAHDVHGLPDLNVENEEVYQHLLTSSVEWIRKVKPDGFRLDAVKHLPLSFWARFNADVRRVAGEDFVLLGEMLDGDAALLAKTVREGKFGQMFDFPLGFALADVFCRGRTPEHLGAVLFNDRLYPEADQLVTLLDNHDLPRILSVCGEDVEKVAQALAVQITARGVPALTYGTEVGLLGEHEPANRADMHFHIRHPLRQRVTELLGLRSESEAIRRGANAVLASGGGLFAYARVVANEAVVVAINQGTEAREVTLPEGAGAAQDLRLRKAVSRLVVAPGEVALVKVAPQVRDGFAALERDARRVWNGEGPKREVVLRVSGPKLGAGETLHVIGGAPELGAWDPAKAPRATDVVRLPEGGVYEYKLVVRGRDGSATWQEGPNQILFLAPGTESPQLTAVWQ